MTISISKVDYLEAQAEPMYGPGDVENVLPVNPWGGAQKVICSLVTQSHRPISDDPKYLKGNLVVVYLDFDETTSDDYPDGRWFIKSKTFDIYDGSAVAPMTLQYDSEAANPFEMMIPPDRATPKWVKAAPVEGAMVNNPSPGFLVSNISYSMYQTYQNFALVIYHRVNGILNNEVIRTSTIIHSSLTDSWYISTFIPLACDSENLSFLRAFHDPWSGGGAKLRLETIRMAQMKSYAYPGYEGAAGTGFLNIDKVWERQFTVGNSEKWIYTPTVIHTIQTMRNGDPQAPIVVLFGDPVYGTGVDAAAAGTDHMSVEKPKLAVLDGKPGSFTSPGAVFRTQSDDRANTDLRARGMVMNQFGEIFVAVNGSLVYDAAPNLIEKYSIHDLDTPMAVVVHGDNGLGSGAAGPEQTYICEPTWDGEFLIVQDHEEARTRMFVYDRDLNYVDSFVLSESAIDGGLRWRGGMFATQWWGEY
ncbi:MAG: hypothetical protein ABFD89_23845 [Bryobacteraceae bacterium]